MKKNKRPSAGQLATIEALNREILKLGNNINRPYAAILTCVSTPLALYLLCMQKWSPFYETYLQAEKARNEYYFNLIHDNALNQKKTFLEIEERLIQLGKLGDYQKKYGKADDVNEVIKHIDSIALDDPEITFVIEKIKKSLFSIYNNLFHRLSSMIGKNSPLLKTDRSFFSLYNNTDRNYKFEVLWHNTNRLLQWYIENLAIMDRMQLVKKNLKFFGREVLFDVFFYQSIAVSLILHHVLFIPSLNYFSPQGLFQPKPPQESKFSNAQTYIGALKNYNGNLSRIEKRNSAISRYSLPVLIVLGFYLCSTLYLETPQLIAVFLSLFITAFTSIQRELVNLHTARSLNKNIAKAQESIRKALEGFPCEIRLERLSSFEITYFIINFNSFKPGADKEKLTGKVMASLFSKCCYINHIELISQRSNSLALSADKLLDYKKLNLVRELFIQAVEREVFIQILRNQLNRLMAAFKAKCLNLSMTFEPGHDNANLPWLKIELSLDGLQQISEDQKNKLEDLLTTLFADLDYKIDKSDESFEISLEGFKSLHEKTLEQIIDEISHLSVKIDRSSLNEGNLEQSSSNSKKLRKPKMEIQKNNKIAVLVRDIRERVIEWPSGRYDSQGINSKVHPVPFGGYESARNYEKARIFFTHKIDPNKIPVDDLSLGNKIFDKLEHLLEAPKIVPVKGHQGFVFWQGMANDLNGKPFQASVKGKLLGEFGDIRFYGEAEKSVTGETLYVIKGVEPHAH